MIPGSLQPAYEKALAEGRLFWCVTDQHGRPSNGGDISVRMPPIGEWSAKITGLSMCNRGWHCTSEPWRWSGSLVWLVEVDRVGAKSRDKIVCGKRRPLACVDPAYCIDPGIFVAASRPHLHSADLYGANLRGANLYGANLYGANLHDAELGIYERGPNGIARKTTDNA